MGEIQRPISRQNHLPLSIVVPCHNEQGNIKKLAEEISASLKPSGSDYEIVFVDDASTDKSWEVIGELCRSSSHVKAIRLAAQSGQSAALWAGLSRAAGEIIITIDADLQNPPAEIPRLLDALNHCDCVCGSRINSRSEGDNFIRRGSSRLANTIRAAVIGDGIKDSGCCFRAFRRKCLDGLWFFRGAHRFFPALLQMAGFHVVEVSVAHRPRFHGKSHYGTLSRLCVTAIDLFGVRWMQSRSFRYQIAAEQNHLNLPSSHD